MKPLKPLPLLACSGLAIKQTGHYWSLTMFETTPINQLLTQTDPDKNSESEPQQQLSPLKKVGTLLI